MDIQVVPICYPEMEIVNTVPAQSSLFSHPSLCKTHLILSIGHFQQRGLKSGRGEGREWRGRGNIGERGGKGEEGHYFCKNTLSPKTLFSSPRVGERQRATSISSPPLPHPINCLPLTWFIG